MRQKKTVSASVAPSNRSTNNLAREVFDPAHPFICGKQQRQGSSSKQTPTSHGQKKNKARIPKQ